MAKTTCTKVSTQVLRGAAGFGREFAVLHFTNGGSAACVLAGYPGVTLLHAGKPVGHPSRPASDTASTYRLRPGATAESMLSVATTCSAPLSDQLRVTVPGTAQSAVRPAELRACTMQVSKLAAPS